MPSSKLVKDIQRSTGTIAIPNWFFSKSADKYVPFFEILRSVVKFTWDDRCDKVFKELKAYLSSPPLLVNPEIREILFYVFGYVGWDLSDSID